MTCGCGIPTSPPDRPFDLSLSEGPSCYPLTNQAAVGKFSGKHPTMPRSVQRPWLAH